MWTKRGEPLRDHPRISSSGFGTQGEVERQDRGIAEERWESREPAVSEPGRGCARQLEIDVRTSPFAHVLCLQLFHQDASKALFVPRFALSLPTITLSSTPSVGSINSGIF